MVALTDARTFGFLFVFVSIHNSACLVSGIAAESSFNKNSSFGLSATLV